MRLWLCSRAEKYALIKELVLSHVPPLGIDIFLQQNLFSKNVLGLMFSNVYLARKFEPLEIYIRN